MIRFFANANYDFIKWRRWAYGLTALVIVPGMILLAARGLNYSIEFTGGTLDLVIDANSLDMGFAKWDEHMKGEEFFHVVQYPTIRFTSDKLIFEGDKVVGAEGKFTLLGTTRLLTLRVDNFHCAPFPLTRKMHCGADVSATISRTQFGMAKYVPMVGDEVKLYSPIEADKD